MRYFRACQGKESSELAEEGVQLLAFVNTMMNLWVRLGKFLKRQISASQEEL
jgi:hypothetical protein